MTARWVVEHVAPHRDLAITWQPISLLRKNNPPEGSPYREASEVTHNMLRVMESVRVTDGNDGVFKLYWEVGTRIHHDGDRTFDIADALKAVGLDVSHAEALTDEKWDDEIAVRMDAGLALTGDDVGTPIIALDDDDGNKVALFGPVISRIPTPEQSLRMWDSFVDIASIPGFWELKRTRTEGPQFGERPAPRT